MDPPELTRAELLDLQDQFKEEFQQILPEDTIEKAIDLMETLPKMYMKLRLQLSNGKDVFIRYIGNNLFLSNIRSYERRNKQNFELNLKKDTLIKQIRGFKAIVEFVEFSYNKPGYHPEEGEPDHTTLFECYDNNCKNYKVKKGTDIQRAFRRSRNYAAWKYSPQRLRSEGYFN